MPSLRHNLKQFIVVIALILPGYLVHGQTQAPWEGKSFSGNPTEIAHAAAEVKADRLYDAVVLLDEREMTVDAAGKSLQRWHLVYRVDSTQRVRNWATTGVSWQPWRQRQPTIRARVIGPDGSEHMLDPATLTDAPAHQNTPDTYGDSRVYRGPLPAVAIGAVVEEEIILEDTAPYLAGGVVGMQWIGRRVPVQHTIIKIISPKAAPVRYEARLLPNLKTQKQEEGDHLNLTFEQGPFEALEKVEPNLPSDFPAGPHIAYSNVPSWKSAAAEYLKLSEPQIKSDDVKPIVASTVKTTDSRADKIAKLTALLHHEIRYTGIEFGQSALVPQAPAEVLKRKYGDCKDKSTLLVSMLREAGIPAYLALLNAGAGQDIAPEMPGIGLFNHAIVYVPGKPEVWIDATDEFSPPGQLASADQGRQGLIIKDGTTALQFTPISTSRENLVSETREFYLSENGPARIVESSETHGSADRNYRSSYGTKRDPKEIQKEIDDYAKNAYVAKDSVKIDHGDGYDLSKPFVLRVEIPKGGRGTTSLRDAAVGIPLSGIVGRLPDYFRTDPDEKKKNMDKSEKPDPPRTADFVLPIPFITEWHYKIVPPPGFKLRANRQNRTEQMGPAVFSQEYKVASDGTVLADFRFDTVKRRYTVAEAEALRKAVLEFRKLNTILITFDQEGYALLSAGKVREAVKSFDDLIAKHPKEALHHIQVADALLEAGLGEAARIEAKEAIALEPQSAIAHKTLAWILQHDLIGRRFKKGFDRENSLTEYKKSLELDPENNDARIDYTILLEYDNDGIRYSDKSLLDEAIKQYEDLKTRKAAWEYLDNNFLFAEFYAGRFKDVIERTLRLDSKPERIALAIASTVALEGAESGIAKSLELTSDEKARMEALTSASTMLINKRRYKEAADLLSKINTGSESLDTVEAIRSTRPYNTILTTEKDPGAVVQKMMVLTVGPNSPDRAVLDLFIPERKTLRKPSDKPKDDMEYLKVLGPALRAALSDFPEDSRGDVFLSHLRTNVEGSDQVGYRVVAESIGINGLSFFVAKQNGRYVILPLDKVEPYAATIIQDLVKRGDLAGARKWLDWMREEATNPTDANDPFDGVLLTHFWRKGQEADQDTILHAAATLLNGTNEMESAISLFTAGREKAKTDQERAQFDFAIVTAYSNAERWTEAKPLAQQLAKSHPDSLTAFKTQALVLAESGDWENAEAAAQAKIAKDPHDLDAIEVLSDALERQARFNDTLKLTYPALSEAKPRASLLNNYAWDALFTDPMPKEAVEAAQRGVRVTENREFGVIHTLACIYAELGRTGEARQLITQSMDTSRIAEPNGSIWYVFGRIAEQYGRTVAAKSAYARVEDDQHRPNSTYALAQKRLKLIGVSQAK